jgi:hypothetical protein
VDGYPDVNHQSVVGAADWLGCEDVPVNVYLGGPMRGIKDFNFPAFHAAAAKLRGERHIVFNPAERDEEMHGKGVSNSPTGDLQDIAKTGFSLRDAMEADMVWICRHGDAIALLPGWENSKGATAERALGVALGLHIMELPE